MKNDSLMLPLLFTAMIAVAAAQGAEKATVPQQAGKNWTQMSPYALVDSLYCPGQKAAGDLAAFTCEIEESHFRGVRAALRVFDSTL